ncbi:MAG: hemin uptake protein HemP [Pseudorhodoferax sp.]
MQATLTLNAARLPALRSRRQTGIAGRARRDGALQSTASALLQGQKAVAISHNGSLYRLQATKLGKLILTK